MAKAIIKINRATIRKLLREDSVNDLKARADRVAAAAGHGFEASVQVGKNRARASVITATQAARRAEAKSGALSKAIGAGR